MLFIFIPKFQYIFNINCWKNSTSTYLSIVYKNLYENNQAARHFLLTKGNSFQDQSCIFALIEYRLVCMNVKFSVFVKKKELKLITRSFQYFQWTRTKVQVHPRNCKPLASKLLKEFNNASELLRNCNIM